jgi:predicted metal-dependent hydrolase
VPIPGHAIDEDTLGELQPLGSDHAQSQARTAPVDCIDSVLLHAWCHLKEYQHGKQDDQLLDHTLPEWRERRQKLNWCELY